MEELLNWVQEWSDMKAEGLRCKVESRAMCSVVQEGQQQLHSSSEKTEKEEF